MALSRGVKLLGFLGWLCYALVYSFTYLYYIYPIIKSEIYHRLIAQMPPKQAESLLAIIPVVSLCSFAIVALILWAVESGITFGLLKLLAPEDRKDAVKYSSTFLLMGHGFYISAITTVASVPVTCSLLRESLLAGHVTQFLSPSLLALNIVTLVVASLYVAVLLRKEFDISFSRCFTATIVGIGLLMAIAIAISAMSFSMSHM